MTVLRFTATIAAAGLAAMLAAPAPVLAQDGAPSMSDAGPVTQSAAMVAGLPQIQVPRSLGTGTRSAGSDILGSAGSTTEGSTLEIVTLPDQPFDLPPGGDGLLDTPMRDFAPSYRVPADRVDAGRQPVDLEEPYMPGLSGDLEEYTPRRTVTFAL